MSAISKLLQTGIFTVLVISGAHSFDSIGEGRTVAKVVLVTAVVG